jgi:hypothetical protein
MLKREDKKKSQIDLISLSKSNKMSSALSDGMAQQRRGTHNYLITDHHRIIVVQTHNKHPTKGGTEIKSLN